MCTLLHILCMKEGNMVKHELTVGDDLNGIIYQLIQYGFTPEYHSEYTKEMVYAYQCLFLVRDNLLISFSKGTGIAEEMSDKEIIISVYKNWNPVEKTGDLIYSWNDINNPHKLIKNISENFKLLPIDDNSNVLNTYKYAMKILQEVKSNLTKDVISTIDELRLNEAVNRVRTYFGDSYFQAYADMPIDCYVYEDRLAVLRKEFAESYLSKEALEYSTDFYGDYAWTWVHFHAVFFEIPTVFKVDFMYIMQKLTLYMGEYLFKIGATPEKLIPMFEENEEKSALIKCRFDFE